eukprot:Opistho-2@26691
MAAKMLVPARHTPEDAHSHAERRAAAFKNRGSNANCDIPIQDADLLGPDAIFAANVLIRVLAAREDPQHLRAATDADYAVYFMVVFRMPELPEGINPALLSKFRRVENVALAMGICPSTAASSMENSSNHGVEFPCMNS